MTLKRGIADSTDLYDWHQQVVNGEIETSRRNATIVVVDETGMGKVASRSKRRDPASTTPESGLFLPEPIRKIPQDYWVVPETGGPLIRL